MSPAGRSVELREIEAGGLRFRADVAGDANGPLVLLLHGFPQTRYAWRHQLPVLAEAGFLAVAPDQRGYSPAARPAGADAYATEALLADALAIADTFGAERFHLVGHDWGGQLSWLIAARHPERLLSLSVLSRPHPAAFVQAMSGDPNQAGRSRHHRAFQRAEATDRLLENNCALLRQMFVDQGVADADADAYLQTLGSRDALDAAINWYRASGGSGLTGDCPAVDVPTLYLWGNADATVGRPAAEATAAFVKARYRFVEVPDVGHFITDQDSGSVNRELLAHLATSTRSLTQDEGLGGDDASVSSPAS